MYAGPRKLVTTKIGDKNIIFGEKNAIYIGGATGTALDTAGDERS